MFELFVSYIMTHYPQIAGCFLGLIIFGIIIWRVAIFWVNTKQSNDLIPTINNTLKKIDGGLNTLNKVLLEKNIISQSCYTSENSPRVLNPIGLKLFEESSASQVFTILKDSLITELEKNQHIDSLLELERESLRLILSKMDNSEFKTIQHFAFEHPTYEGNPLTYTDILFVMSLRLRDAYREKHPELNDQEINSSTN